MRLIRHALVLIAVIWLGYPTLTLAQTENNPGEPQATPSPEQPKVVAPVAIDPKPYLEKGKTLLTSGNFRGALAAYNQLIQLNPNIAEAYAGRGSVRFNLGDRQGAISDFSESKRLNPEAIATYLNDQLQAAINSQNWSSAVKVLDQMIIVFPKQAGELKAYRDRIIAIRDGR